MGESNLPTAELLKTVLEPLLEDFDYWFGEALKLLQNEKIEFMSDQEQCDLLLRVQQAQAELSTFKMLFIATDAKVGIDMATLTPWHKLVTECWSVGIRFRQLRKI